MAVIMFGVADSAAYQPVLEALQQKGHRVLTAARAEQCVAVCQTWPVDLVLLDSALSRHGGYDIHTRLRDLPQYNQHPILMLGYDDDDLSQTKLETAMTHHIPWPSSPEAVLANVEQHLEQQMMAAGGEQFAWLRSLFEQAQDGMFRGLLDNQFVEVNPALVWMLGYATKQEVYALDVPQQIYANPEDYKALCAQLNESGAANNQEIFWRKKDGTLILVTMSIRVVSGRGGIKQCVGEIKEITRTRQIEETLHTITEVTAAVTGTDYFRQLVYALATTLHASYVFVGELIAPEIVQTLAYWEKGAYGENFNYNLHNTPCETVVNNAISYYPRNVQALFPNDVGLKQMGIESYLGTPLFGRDGTPLGVLVVTHDAELDILAWVKPMMQVLAERTGVEIERQRMHHMLQRRLERDLMINTISTTFINLPFEQVEKGIRAVLYTIGEQLSADRGYIFLYEGSSAGRDTSIMSLTHYWGAEGVPFQNPYPEGLIPTHFPWLNTRITSQETVMLSRIGDLPPEASAEYAECQRLGIQSLFLVPLAYTSEPIGCLGFDAIRQARDWSLDDIPFLQMIGEILTTTLVRHAAEKAEREQRLMTEVIANITARLNSGAELKPALDNILERLAQVIPYHVADVSLIEGGISRVIGFRYHGEDKLQDNRLKIELPVKSTSNLRRMVETKSTLIISDVKQDPDWVDVEDVVMFHGYLGAPIILNREVIGFLHLLSDHADAFSPDQARRLQIFAAQIGSAIRNAWLFDSVQRHATELEQRVLERTVEVEYQRRQLKAILDGIDEGVMGALHYAPGSIIPQTRYVNPAMEQLLGFGVDDWDVYKARSETYTPEEFDAILDEVDQALRRNQVWHKELKLRRRNGTEFDAAVTVARISAVEDEITPSRVMIVRDISQTKALEAQKARFVVNAAHELRTPITNIKTRLYLIDKKPEEFGMHLKVISNVTETMRDLIEKMLDISRFEHGVIALEKQTITVETLVRAVTQEQSGEAENKDVTLVTELPEAPLRMNVDVVRIKQVLTNLVTNAINHTSAGGTITLSSSSEDGSILLKVRDTGIGIKPEHLPHLFEPFYQVEGRDGGLGLGLSITKEIVELHGGALDVESEFGQGSCFTVRLPKMPN
ncbi:MAG: GAF domain-containing protein [Anaerolineaceae bacterium]|nr:GAF domain-containing protein [Anaerolineaceae bacterium]